MPHQPVVSWAPPQKSFLCDRVPGPVHVKLTNIKLQARRAYTMGVRAEAAAATAERILDATVDVFWELPTNQVSLDEVARRARVTVQTVIRRFGGRDGLIAAAADRQFDKVRRERAQAPVGDVAGVVQNLVEHYETYGDGVFKMLAEEERNPGLREIADRGRAMHREWCTGVFARSLSTLKGLDRTRRLAEFVAVCDAYVWKLLRRDAGLSRRQTELALIELLNPLVQGV